MQTRVIPWLFTHRTTREATAWVLAKLPVLEKAVNGLNDEASRLLPLDEPLDALKVLFRTAKCHVFGMHP